MFRSLIRKVREWRKMWRTTESLIRIEISTSALVHNVTELKKLAPEWGIIPVLKANAYGHGIVQVADIMKNIGGVPFFAVDSYFEAEQLRGSGITKPLLVLGFSRTETITRNTLRNVAFAIGSLEQLEELSTLSAPQTVHLKFDTGMHRQGIVWTDASEVIQKLRGTALRVEGLCTHLAESEMASSTLTTKQLERWNDIATRFQREFPSIKHYHAANSGGFGYAKDIVANTGRCGIALYGINPGNLSVSLRPALRMLSVISALRTIEKGETVGYNATFVAEKRMRLATVPVGYYEGVDRRLSNKGAYMINGALAPIRGRVSMNISSCDVSDIPGVLLGTEVEIIGSSADARNSVETMVRLCETAPHDMTVHIPAHLRRVVVA